MNGKMLRIALPALLVITGLARSQTPAAPAPASGIPSVSLPSVSLEDALKRARQYGGQVQAANFAVLLAREDRVQARALALPSVNAINEFIYTEGNGTPTGVFVANNGVHVYNEQAQVHEELLSVFRRGEIRRALANEAAARARVQVAARGLNATVIQDYYAIASATRKLANARVSLAEAQRFLDITQKQEAGGEAAHADVIKAQIQLQQRQRDVDDAQLALEKAKIALGVLIFPNFTTDFTIIDDLEASELVPPVQEVRAKALSTSPDLAAARFGVEAAGFDVGVARYGYLPSFTLDFFYGINANQFAVNGIDREAGNPDITRRNLGYAAQASLNIPVWNWGATRSKVRQAELRRSQAQLDLTLAQRTIESDLATLHAEARAAQAQIASLRSSSELAAESLRLTILRYQAGEATALEVVDAQTTVTQARNAYDDGLARYRVALANLQTLTGSF